jgi:hydroxymethylpyrimidine pyrophosphatase-like HAD family hydrolase
MNAALVFDIDNTLTPPRQALGREMAQRLSGLDRRFALAAGSDRELLMGQFFEPLHAHGFRGEIDAFLCNGASRYRCRSGDALSVEAVDEFSLRGALGTERFDRLLSLLGECLGDPAFALPAGIEVVGERIVNRDAALNFAPSGRPRGELSTEARASRDAFVAFDEASGYRARLLPDLRGRIDRALPGHDLLLTLGGQTSFDIVQRGRDKSFAVRSLLDEGVEHVTYLGDALFPGGNDAAVADFVRDWSDGECPVEVIQVDGWEHTARILDGWRAERERPTSVGGSG